MRWIVMGLAAIVVLAALVWVIGMTRPKGHVARTQARYTHPPDSVWATLTDHARWAEWNPEVKAVERLPDRNGHTVLRVTGSWGDATSEFTVHDPPHRLVTSMDAGSFRGSWSYDLEPGPDGGTLLTITEQGEVDSPLFRAMLMFHDMHATMMAYHQALAARLGEAVTPVRLEVASR